MTGATGRLGHKRASLSLGRGMGELAAVIDRMEGRDCLRTISLTLGTDRTASLCPQGFVPSTLSVWRLLPAGCWG